MERFGRLGNFERKKDASTSSPFKKIPCFRKRVVVVL
jgi:hypothetical protein